MLDEKINFDSLVYTVSELIGASENTLLKDVFAGGQLSIQQTDYDRWNGGTYGYTIYCVIDVKTFVRLKENLTQIEEELFGHFNLATRHLENENIHRVSIIPKGEAAKLPIPNPHRTFTEQEAKRKQTLLAYLKDASEDNLIEEILLPLFRQMGFHRITSIGHKDKALEYGKDIWMKYTLPTQHILYFGIQVKKGKIDSSGVSKPNSGNIAEIYNQLLMMIGHEIFDPETSRRVLVDHAFIIAGGEITKQAKNWLGERLDTTKRSQVLFMDRDDIVNLFIVNNLPLPNSALKKLENPPVDDLPF